MKKTRIFMAAGTLVLAISAIFATKANKKFFTVFTGVANSSDYFQVSSSVGLLLTTKSNSNEKAVYFQLVTGGGTGHYALSSTKFALETTVSHAPIYLKP